MNNKSFLVLAVGILSVFFIGLYMYYRSAETLAPNPIVAISSEYFVRPHSQSMGNKESKVLVVEWFDPECESCREIHPIFKKIIADYKDKVHFVSRYMPYHANSMFAASALEESKEFGKYEAALDLLFEKQPEWGDHHNPRPELIAAYLEKIGIPKKNLEKEALIKKHQEKILLDQSDGQKVGVTGTPEFFVNGVIVGELSDRAIRQAIEIALSTK